MVHPSPQVSFATVQTAALVACRTFSKCCNQSFIPDTSLNNGSVGKMLRNGAGRSPVRSISKQVDVHQPFMHLFDRQCRSITHGLPSSTQGSDAQTAHDAGAQRSSSSVQRRAPAASHAAAASANALPEHRVLTCTPHAAWLTKPEAAEARQHAVPTCAASSAQ